jgi:hypothetical protein
VDPLARKLLLLILFYPPLSTLNSLIAFASFGCVSIENETKKTVRTKSSDQIERDLLRMCVCVAIFRVNPEKYRWGLIAL